MIFNKCERCGCFFTSDTNICCNCSSRDASDIAKLKTYFEEGITSTSLDSISLDTGITLKNLNRFLKDEDFSDYVSDIDLESNDTDIGNISINL